MSSALVQSGEQHGAAASLLPGLVKKTRDNKATYISICAGVGAALSPPGRALRCVSALRSAPRLSAALALSLPHSLALSLSLRRGGGGGAEERSTAPGRGGAEGWSFPRSRSASR